MSDTKALDELLKELPTDFDEMDICDWLVEHRDQAAAELEQLKECVEKLRETGVTLHRTLLERNQLRSHISPVHSTLTQNINV